MVRVFLSSILLLILSFGSAQAQLSTDDGTSTTANPLTGGSTSPAAEVQNGGLGVKILFLGKNPDGVNLTVSAQILNLTDKTVKVALIGPPPGAVDDLGTTYDMVKASGIGGCRYLQAKHISSCMTNVGNYLPGNNFTQITAGQSVIVPISLKAQSKTSGTMLSYSMNLAVHAGDEAVGDDQARQLQNIAVSFPLIPLDK